MALQWLVAGDLPAVATILATGPEAAACVALAACAVFAVAAWLVAFD